MSETAAQRRCDAGGQGGAWGRQVVPPIHQPSLSPFRFLSLTHRCTHAHPHSHTPPTYPHSHTHTCTHVCTHNMNIHMCTHVCTYAYPSHTCTQPWHVYTLTYTHVCPPTCPHTRTHAHLSDKKESLTGLGWQGGNQGRAGPGSLSGAGLRPERPLSVLLHILRVNGRGSSPPPAVLAPVGFPGWKQPSTDTPAPLLACTQSVPAESRR